MKILAFLFLTAVVALLVYFYSSKLFAHGKKKKKANWKVISIVAGVVLCMVAFGGIQMYRDAMAPDAQCVTIRIATSHPPASLTTATDYFLHGNYEYDIGNCRQAIADYTHAILLNTNYPQAYNNRAYTYMRMQDYRDALPDLDKAIQLSPNYIQALMNRGDIHNYYYQIDRQAAINDYEKVISLDGMQGTSVCGHLMLARHNGWNLGTLPDYFRGVFHTCN